MAVKKSGASGKRGSPRKSAAGPAGTRTPFAPEPGAAQLQAGTEAEIRRRAYELYEARGRQEGFDREDWSQAEAEILARLRKKGSA